MVELCRKKTPTHYFPDPSFFKIRQIPQSLYILISFEGSLIICEFKNLHFILGCKVVGLG